METCKPNFCYRWIMRRCIWKRRLVLQLSFRMRPECFSWMDVFPDLTAFIVLSEESRVVQANFASTLNASTIASTPNRSTITKKTWKLENVKTCPLKLPFFPKNIFHPWLPQLLQSFGPKYTCIKRYALFPQFADGASLVLLKKNC